MESICSLSKILTEKCFCRRDLPHILWMVYIWTTLQLRAVLCFYIFLFSAHTNVFVSQVLDFLYESINFYFNQIHFYQANLSPPYTKYLLAMVIRWLIHILLFTFIVLYHHSVANKTTTTTLCMFFHYDNFIVPIFLLNYIFFKQYNW